MLDYSHISNSSFDAHFHFFCSILWCHLVLPFAGSIFYFIPTFSRYLSPYQPKPLRLISLISGSCFSLAALKFNNVQKRAGVLFTEAVKHAQECTCSSLPRKWVGLYHLNSRAHLTTKNPVYVIGMGITDSWLCQQGRAQGWKRKADSSHKWASLKWWGRRKKLYCANHCSHLPTSRKVVKKAQSILVSETFSLISN